MNSGFLLGFMLFLADKALSIDLSISMGRWGRGKLGKREGKCCLDSFISDSL